ncbi:MAG TPA: ATP-binding protein, partial [Solirubrobacterales bacterium]|nr:ATP-binding protein [Solirubrobacterales bacterium]
MLFRDRPLSPSSVDAGLYVARPGLESMLLRPLEQGRNTLLIGDAGSGKTTLMRQLADRLQGEGKEVVWLNASLADSAVDLLAMAEKAMARGAPSPLPLDEEADGRLRLLTLSRALAAHPPA